MKSGQLDLGLTMLPENEQGISCEKILEDEIYCIAPKDFRVKNGHSISEEDLVNCNFILQQSDYDLDTKAALDHYSIKSTAIRFSIDDQSIVAMVEAGLGLGILIAAIFPVGALMFLVAAIAATLGLLAFSIIARLRDPRAVAPSAGALPEAVAGLSPCIDPGDAEAHQNGQESPDTSAA